MKRPDLIRRVFRLSKSGRHGIGRRIEAILDIFLQSDNLKGYGNKINHNRERIGRVGQRRQVVIPREMLETLNIQEGNFVAFAEQKNGVLIKPRSVADPDGVLTPEESALVKKAEREMRQGKFVTLAQLRHDLDRPHPRRRGKIA